MASTSYLQLKKLAKRKGYRIIRYYSRWFKGYFYRIVAYPWPSMRDRIQNYEYCKTHLPAAARARIHLQSKPDVTRTGTVQYG